MQNIEIFHFVLLEPVLGRSLMVSSLCSQCVAALQGKDKLGTSEDDEEIPALNGGEMSPVLRSWYQTGVYHGLTYKSHDQVKKCTSLPFLFFITLACWLFFLLGISSWKVLVVGFFWVFFGKQDFVISLTEIKVSSLRLKVLKRMEWVLHMAEDVLHWTTGHLNQPSASLGTGVIFTWFCLSSWDRTMYRLRALHSPEAASYVISNTSNAHQQAGTACFHFFVFANLLCGMFP